VEKKKRDFSMNSENNTLRAQAMDAPPSVHVIQLPELPEAPQDSADVLPLKLDAHPLHQVRTRLQVCVGEAVITVGELLGAKENQVLKLDRTLDQAVDLLLEGQVVARGQLVAVDDHFAVRITELPLPLQLTTDGKA
jgi:flagellar motor switch protein FliN/FliY